MTGEEAAPGGKVRVMTGEEGAPGGGVRVMTGEEEVAPVVGLEGLVLLYLYSRTISLTQYKVQPTGSSLTYKEMDRVHVFCGLEQAGVVPLISQSDMEHFEGDDSSVQIFC